MVFARPPVEVWTRRNVKPGLVLSKELASALAEGGITVAALRALERAPAATAAKTLRYIAFIEG